ncbi:MAG: FAD-dependent oxidoreductase [Candidatus Saliniplasma sp.]
MKVKNTLDEYPYKISFQVKDDIVFLRGEVDSHKEWVDIGLDIGDIKGVEGVVNDIEWKDKQKRSDEERIRKYQENKDKKLGEHDIVIIGGGIIGCAIARELSKYKIDAALVEKEPDVSLGQSRANNGMVHPGLAPSKRSLNRELNVRGNQMYEDWCEELDVPFKRVGSLILMTSRTLEKYKKYMPGPLYRFVLRHVLPWFVKRKGKSNGLEKIEVLNSEEVKKEESHVTDDVISAVKVPSTGIVDPYQMTIALYENARKNGVKFYLETEVVGFNKKRKSVQQVVTDEGYLDCDYVINAAGLYSDEIAEMADAREYTIHPRKGVELLFNRRLEDWVYHCLAELRIPSPPTSKGGGINPTVHGNIIWGPTAEEVERKNDTSVEKEKIKAIKERYSTIMPDFPKDDFIRYFAGVRAASFTEDFIIRPAKWVKNFLHVAGIQSPGVASAPAVADYAIEQLEKMSVELEKDEDFDGKRTSIDRAAEMNKDELKGRIEEDERWGNIVCTCEMVSEAEIVEAINRGAESFDAIKRRTRAGMGECQESYCLLRIAEIISEELDIPLNKVKKEWDESNFFDGIVRGEEG